MFLHFAAKLAFDEEIKQEERSSDPCRFEFFPLHQPLGSSAAASEACGSCRARPMERVRAAVSVAGAAAVLAVQARIHYCDE